MIINFEPIEASEAGVERLDHEDQEKITELLMGRTVVKVDDEHLVLDNGTALRAIGYDGGCCCAYDLSVLNGCDNIITRVDYDYQPGSGYYRIFVYAENQQINLMQVDGSDGSGYYGTGYELLVRPARDQDETGVRHAHP